MKKKSGIKEAKKKSTELKKASHKAMTIRNFAETSMFMDEVLKDERHARVFEFYVSVIDQKSDYQLEPLEKFRLASMLVMLDQVDANIFKFLKSDLRMGEDGIPWFPSVLMGVELKMQKLIREILSEARQRGPDSPLSSEELKKLEELVGNDIEQETDKWS